MATRKEQTALWDAAEIIHRAYEDLFRPVAATFDLTPGQLRLLHVLHRHGALSVGALALAVGMARTNTSSLCKQLSKRGFLLRHRGSAGDDRQVLLELTPEGESAARQADSQLDLFARKLEGLDLKTINEHLCLVSDALTVAQEAPRKKANPLPKAAARMLDAAKSALRAELTKKELQHGKE